MVYQQPSTPIRKKIGERTAAMNKRQWRRDPRETGNVDKVTLGYDILPKKVDGRTTFVRRIRAYYDMIINDLGGHDNPQLSTIQKGVAKGCAALLSAMDEMLMNKANGEYIEGEPWDLKAFQETEKAFTHLARQIGYDRKPKFIENESLTDVISDIKKRKPVLRD